MFNKIFLVVISALFLAACSQQAAPGQAPSTQAPSAAGQTQAAGGLTVQNFAFAPNPLTVKKGQTLTVTNNDSVPHTVTSDDGTSFNVGPINPGASVTLTVPAAAGSYGFHCNIHKTMTSTLVVQ